MTGPPLFHFGNFGGRTTTVFGATPAHIRKGQRRANLGLAMTSRTQDIITPEVPWTIVD